MHKTATEVSSENHNQHDTTPFTVVERQIPCDYRFQLYVDYGQSHAGPWLKIGLNETEFGFGYIPRAQLHVVSQSAS